MEKKEAGEAVITDLMQCKDPESTMKFYDTWSGSYDEDVEKISISKGVAKFAEIAAEFARDRTSCKVIDIGAGTGISGQALQQQGFENVDAIDGSSGMLEVARAKKVYKQLFHELIDCERIRSFPPESYDLAFATGAFAPGHLGSGHALPVLAALSQRGLFVMSVRHRWRSTAHVVQLMETFQSLIDAGKCELVTARTIEKIISDEPAKVFVYRKL